ncbi:MAG: thiamine pyrophosphate-binding protein, partial [Chloroflexi bacterium]|nr:thiamine pyrophosphate-binding protein [Chloroflexota bacterium]
MLKAYGVKYVFGVPGDTSVAFYDALYEARGEITHVMARDERGASFMADVYARLSNRPGVCDAPSGGGATYLIPGLAEANASSIPLIALTTDIPLAFAGRNVLTELNQDQLFAAVTKWRATLTRADRVPEVFRKAFRLATTGRPGVTQITIPEDVLDEPIENPDFRAETACREFPAYRTAPDAAAVAEAADVLLRAKRPLAVAGGGAASSGAWDELTQLADMLSIPVGTSINGQGSIDEMHRFSIGVVGGNGARPYANEVLAAADLVMFVGCKADSVTTLNWTLPAGDGSVTIIQIDVDPGEIGNTYPVAAGVVADARLALQALVAEVKSRLAPMGGAASREPWADFAGLRSAWWAEQESKLRSDARPIKPQRVMRALRELLPPNSVIVADPGTGTPFTSAFYSSPAGRHVIIPRGHGGLGYAIPGVVGAKLARPDAPVIGIVGDGSFGMACGDLETIARLKLPVVLVQFNNSEFGWIKELQHLYRGSRYLSVDFTRDTDYAAIAQGFGVQGLRVEDPADLLPALRSALD